MEQVRQILYVCEASVPNEPALARAVSLAESCQAGLTVLDVVPDPAAGVTDPPVATEFRSAVVSRRRRELEAWVARDERRPGIEVDVRIGTLFLEAVRAVLRGRFDLLVKPAGMPGPGSRFFGSDDMHLLRKCPCPVWLVRPDEKARYASLLAAVDCDPDTPDLQRLEGQGLNRRILELGGALARADRAAFHLVHVWDAPAELMVRSWAVNPDEAAATYVDGKRSRHESAFHFLRDEWRDQIGEEAWEELSPRCHLLRGAPATVIPEATARLQADLVVMGTVARTGIAGLLIGNTAETIVGQLQCAVLAVKPPGFVSPIELSE